MPTFPAGNRAGALARAGSRLYANRAMSPDPLHIIQWGRLDYLPALAGMRQYHARRVAGQVPDALICVEHPAVFTLGKHGRRENVLLSDAELATLGFGLHFVERGGDVTYHGPGQAVVYPVVDLKARGLGVRALVEAVQGACLATARAYGVAAELDPDKPGAWVRGRKLAAVGLAVPQKVSMHGLAFNVNTRLEDFQYIRACGLDAPPTSLMAELGRPLDLVEAHARICAELSVRLTAEAAQG